MNVHKASAGVESRIYEAPENDPDNLIKHELGNLKGESIPELVSMIKGGGKFIVFYYRLAIFVISYQRFSPAIFIRNEEEFHAFRKKYNRMALLKGLFYVPFGPLPALKEIRLNNKGGLDVTGDILLNITEEDLNNQVVYIKEMHTLFGHVAKTDMKYFKKVLIKYGQSHPEIQEIYVGTFLNVDQFEEPPFCIGISVDEMKTIEIEDVEKALYKQFRSFNAFMHFDLNATGEEMDIAKKFKSQGEMVYSRMHTL